MDDTTPPLAKDRFAYWALLFYAVLFSVFSAKNVDLIRVPAFALLLLVLLQVIFPQFRCTKRANLIAVFVIVFIPLLAANLHHS